MFVTLKQLKVAIHVGYHQDLLEDLRRLRQRVKLPVMNAARDQAISRAFGGRARQDRSLDLKKTELVERLANLKNHAMPQLDISVQARAAQIEIAVAQAGLFARGRFVFDLKRRRLRIIQNVQARGD